MHNEKAADVLIVGSGIAAYMAALQISKHHKHVCILTKSTKKHSNSVKAQGGIAAAIAQTDDWKKHYKDTLTAGAFHNDEEHVKLLVKKGAEMIKSLLQEGMPFDREKDGSLSLGMEGAHCQARILHAGGDATGWNMMAYFEKQLQEKVEFRTHHTVTDLLIEDGRCIGVKVREPNGSINRLYASAVVLATGGCGSLYSHSSNDPAVSGDGLAIAFRAGVELADLEFIQFHPTLLTINGESFGLISEAVRGEGAFLIDEDGKRIMENAHPLQDLAPRDVVAREIYYSLTKGKQVFLNVSNVKDFASRFPTITRLCQTNGVDLEKGLIPVAPGAHFTMGGIVTNQHGQTSLPGLYAIGEAACTGVHGANRLASNSLLEGLVFGSECAKHIVAEPSRNLSSLYTSSRTMNRKQTYTLPAKSDIQRVMMEHVGIIRTNETLEQAKAWFEQYMPALQSLPEDLSENDSTIVNMITVGWLITTSALLRKESRGAHYRSDYPLEEQSLAKKRIIRTLKEWKQPDVAATGVR
ncbi:L-aspartate oxidase [Bacillus tianshenii]|nr:L-aspartate oxidase [Bacillus tianshenii]